MVPEHESKVTAGSASNNLVLLGEVYLSKITLIFYLGRIYVRRNLRSNIFVGWCSCSYGGTKFNYLSRWLLDTLRCLDEGFSVYQIRKIYLFFLPTLDGSASILRPRSSMNFLHPIILSVQMGSLFSVSRITMLEVRFEKPAVSGSNHKHLRCFPRYPQVFCTTTS